MTASRPLIATMSGTLMALRGPRGCREWTGRARTGLTLLQCIFMLSA